MAAARLSPQEAALEGEASLSRARQPTVGAHTRQRGKDRGKGNEDRGTGTLLLSKQNWFRLLKGMLKMFFDLWPRGSTSANYPQRPSYQHTGDIHMGAHCRVT